MSVPESVPILSAGRHADPTSGGCFMEVASLLAGERWSDHPTSVHPTLGALARAVNDRTSDAARPALAPLIPSTIGTAGRDPRIAAVVVATCARRALADPHTLGRRLLTSALRRSERVLAEPHPRTWWRRRARACSRGMRTHAVQTAVLAVAHSAGPGADAALRELLAETIAQVNAVGRPPAPAGTEKWATACELLGTAADGR